MDSPEQDGTGLFQCSSCQRSFTRMDHLARHVRSHLKERPYECEVCQKSFGRVDLLKRHMACHQEGPRKRQKSSLPPVPRVSRACRLCAASKLKCDETQPCGRCRKKGVQCERAPMPGASPMTTVPEEQRSLSEGKPRTPETMEDGSTPVTEDHEFHQMSGFLRGAMGSEQTSAAPQEHWSQSAGDGLKFLLDFTVDDMGDFDTSDFGPFELPCNEKPEVPIREPPQVDDTSTASAPSTSPNDHVALGAEAYRQSSLGHWEPGPSDHSAAELEHLAFVSASQGLDLESRSMTAGESLIQPIQRTTRDRLLAMILSTCRPEHTHLVSRAFPSAELLNNLLDRFASDHRLQADASVHLPTLKTSEAWPVFLASIIAMGALKTGDRALHRFGFALQEAVRTTLPSKFEEANSVTRMIWSAQTMIFEIEVGLWSGMKRKMEIAESHCQVPYTMLRRSGRFQRRKADLIAPLAEDSEYTLERKWLAWVEKENWKRLAFHAFLVDGQVSMAFLTPRVISFAEMTIELPAHEDLWWAKNATDWKTAWFKHPPTHELSLVDYQQKPQEIPSSCDARLSALAILHGLWGMTYQFLQMTSVSRRPGQQQTATLALVQQEILQSLGDFRTNILEAEDTPCPRSTLVLELMLMRIYASLEDIEKFAGRGSQEQARDALPKLQQWVEGRDSRQAIWHAGQVLRAASTFERGQTSGFYAIAVFHASLVMWAYSVVAGTRGPSQKSTSKDSVCLDGPTSSAVQRFITLGKGRPCIRGSTSSPVPLSEPEAAMRVVMDVLDGDHSSERRSGQSCQPLIQNLNQLLRGIGRAAATLKGEVGSAA
ncbi:c6 zinc finger domain-containing protein [Plectosphaerella plurivora]|uniref:C6 zinc finger domain-containing protein n=1 Tax=Plectosphaerella plurivora TaxID=936078 RepID=A0A9P8V1Q1_9PEZI|nr:c6 zinc finger domain-containing protein [Plectosphaerella plurivora]